MIERPRQIKESQIGKNKYPIMGFGEIGSDVMFDQTTNFYSVITR
jgi:hypothetical protein